MCRIKRLLLRLIFAVNLVFFYEFLLCAVHGCLNFSLLTHSVTKSPSHRHKYKHPQIHYTEKPFITILLVLEKLQAFSCKWKIDNRQLLHNHLIKISIGVDIKFYSLERCMSSRLKIKSLSQVVRTKFTF